MQRLQRRRESRGGFTLLEVLIVLAIIGVIAAMVVPRLVAQQSRPHDGTLGSRTKLIDAVDQGALDGFRIDRDGNLWCGWGSNGALQSEPTEIGGRKIYQLKGKSEDLDGVMVFNPQGKPLAFIRLPERCANLSFGGPKNNRLYMTACHSLYAFYVEAHGAI